MSKNNFKQFCVNITNNDIPDISDEMDILIERKSAIDHIGGDIKHRVDILDKISIPYVEKKFEDLNSVTESLERSGNTDIPDGIMNNFSKKIFDTKFNNLESGWKRSIIAVLSVYILI